MIYQPSSLEAAIHAHWPQKTGLSLACPVGQVFTGLAPPDTPLPYVSIERTSTPLDRRGNRGDVEDVQLRMNILAENFDVGRKIVQLLKASANANPPGFSRDAFDIDSRQRCVAMLCDNDFYMQDFDGVWQFTVDWVCKVESLIADRAV